MRQATPVECIYAYPRVTYQWMIAPYASDEAKWRGGDRDGRSDRMYTELWIEQFEVDFWAALHLLGLAGCVISLCGGTRYYWLCMQTPTFCGVSS